MNGCEMRLNYVYKIYKLGDHQTIDFAVEELKKYLEHMAAGKISVKLEYRQGYNPCEEDGLWVGVLQLPELSEVDNPQLDDDIYIDVNGGKGIISGVNTRSVLLAVYRFLMETGCRWVRPGKSGEFIPQRETFDFFVKINEKAAYRHRGICIEGSVNYENVADIIDWAPKLGFNSYFIQFKEAYTFFERWYTHQNNPIKKPEAFSVEKAREYTKKAENEIKKRGLIYHAVGHGWTCEPLGIPALGWDAGDYNISPDVACYIAEVNGKRSVWKNIPVTTNLCYSNPEVRRVVIKNIVEHIQKNENIDILHFWLADDGNNHCECKECKKATPSDYFVKMLNELDEQLTQKCLNTKVVFLIYLDLLWPAEIEPIKNQDRFILMFAPGRTYSEGFTAQGVDVTLPKYERNQLKFSSNIKDNLAFLKEWKQNFDGDSFDFDYHFMLDHYNDPGYYKVAEMLYWDIRHLKDVDLNGLVSCQVQRAFFPIGLGMYVMGRTLWNDHLDFDDIAEEYFNSAFGTEAKLCKVYLTTLSELFDPPYLRGEKPQVSVEASERFRHIPVVIDQFRPVIERNIGHENECIAKSWQYLKYHAVISTHMAAVFEARACDDKSKSLELWEKLKRIVWEYEDVIQPVFDLLVFINYMDSKLNA